MACKVKRGAPLSICRSNQERNLYLGRCSRQSKPAYQGAISAVADDQPAVLALHVINFQTSLAVYQPPLCKVSPSSCSNADTLCEMAFVQNHASSSKSRAGGRSQTGGHKGAGKGDKVKSNQIKRQRADAELQDLQVKVDGFVSIQPDSL